MVLIYLNTGECIEVKDAVSVERRKESLVCLDRNGHATARFNALEVLSFTADEEMAEAIMEEVCDDLTVLDHGDAVEEPDPA